MTGICPGLKHSRPVSPHNSEPFPELHYGFVIQLGGERQKKHQPPLNLFFHIQELVPRQHIPCPFHKKHFLLVKIDIVVDKFYQVKFLYALNCTEEVLLLRAKKIYQLPKISLVYGHGKGIDCKIPSVQVKFQG